MDDTTLEKGKSKIKRINSIDLSRAKMYVPFVLLLIICSDLQKMIQVGRCTVVESYWRTAMKDGCRCTALIDNKRKAREV